MQCKCLEIYNVTYISHNDTDGSVPSHQKNQVEVRVVKKSLFLLLLLLIFTAFFISCDFILPAPLGRNNPFDDEAQIGRFNVAVSGSDSIITNWDWHDAAPGISANRVIDKIRIVHQQNNRPGSKYPLNPDNVQEYTSTIEWSYNWTGLKTDMDHYFALYAHEKGGVWLAPRNVEIYLDTSPKSISLTLESDDLSPPDEDWEFKAIRVQNLTYNVTDFSASTTAYGWAVGDIFVIRFKDFNTVYFDKFLFSIYNQVPGSNVKLKFYALRKNYENIVDWNDLTSSETMDYGSELSREILIINGADQDVDITPVINKMIFYGTASIAISIDNPLTITVGYWTIDTHFWGNN